MGVHKADNIKDRTFVMPGRQVSKADLSETTYLAARDLAAKEKVTVNSACYCYINSLIVSFDWYPFSGRRIYRNPKPP
ncbi:MAG: hypothetical protein L7W43_04250 [Rubripirellula sp.]|nr:hypothetical protein [Rubripirellula sp.]